ncbi:MAG: primosomal protein N' [Candidatus Dadabacteria bacterium]|nr:primosomal protein N' [Candidatus Dadabacteria bacterium]NIS10211.1 primosomal protein N' [Candidatus Dadabacteria bacterium]NIV42656.1 primosomal protein N' [Candidatus Dadabacteria bacterium]NIX16579.1 primosomal protein N' [Candidatus Dadabacteria bacterium]NIY23126.1 primosomal protein N' [Candidatus Dadabacteria bacterium]
MKQAAKVAFPIPGSEFYHYKIPDSLSNMVALGHRVLVPIKSRKSAGYVIGLEKPPAGIKLKEIIDVLDDQPLFDKKRLSFFKWVSDYYLVSLGIILKTAHPGGLGISINKVVSITGEGKSALGSQTTDLIELQILNALSAASLSINKILELVEGSTNALINKLRSKKLIEIDYVVDKKSFIKTERFISSTPKTRNEHLFKVISKKRPAKGKILEFILRNENIEHAELKEVFGNLSGHLKWLEENGYIEIETKEVIRDPYSEIKITKEKRVELNIDQKVCLKEIESAYSGKSFSPFLLHGVTGSGKTEVYLRAIEHVLNKGREALVLVPEISLTPQLVKRFKARFGSRIAVLHSEISDSERFDSWQKISEGKIKIAIGARSSIFAPFNNLGIIVVDEEHEQSYKQEESPHYNARDLALVLGKIYNSVVVLGSATPSVETYSNTLKEKVKYLSLPLRATNSTMPKVEIVDIKNEKNMVISESLKEALLDSYNSGNQSIIFLNRRGFSSVLVCRACGETLQCPNCSITLTYHKSDGSVKCHYCGIDEDKFTGCIKCGNLLIEYGIGTQRVEEEIKQIVPGARCARMDRDEVRGKKGLIDLYNRLQRNEIDVLVGTQMVAKGHDLPGVILVGVISADMSLSIPDFRAGERTFQLLTQVAGRAGRGSGKGRVIVQTLKPENSVIKYAAAQDSANFLKNELKLRSALGYPPFARLVNIKFTAKAESQTSGAANTVRAIASKLLQKFPMDSIEILGPSACPIGKIKNKYRWQLLIKSGNQRDLHKFAKGLKKAAALVQFPAGIKISFDIDPMSFS